MSEYIKLKRKAGKLYQEIQRIYENNPTAEFFPTPQMSEKVKRFNSLMDRMAAIDPAVPTARLKV